MKPIKSREIQTSPYELGSPDHLKQLIREALAILTDDPSGIDLDIRDWCKSARKALEEI